MSKSISPRAKSRDWSALLAEARANDRQLNAEELELWRRGVIDGEAHAWGPDYVDALQTALDKRNPVPLLTMLDAGLPLPRALVPVIGDVLRAATHGTVRGAPSKLTAANDASIRWYHDKMRKYHGLSVKAITLHLADLLGVDVSTIKRSLSRTRR